MAQAAAGVAEDSGGAARGWEAAGEEVDSEEAEEDLADLAVAPPAVEVQVAAGEKTSAQ